MKRRAQLAFNSQCLLHHHTNTIPGNIAKLIDIDEINKEVGSGRRMTEDLHTLFRAKGISVPLAGSSNKRKEGEDLTVFLVDLRGTLEPQSFATSLNVKKMDMLPKYCEQNIPSNPKTLELVETAAGRSSAVPLKNALEEARKSQFTDRIAVERLRKEFEDHIMEQVEGNCKMPYVKEMEAALLREVCFGTGARMGVFGDVLPFLKVAGQKKDGDAAEAEKKSCVVMFSSSTVAAQKTYLSNAKEGDLSPYITEYIDAGFAGSKLMPRSYTKVRTHLTELLQTNIKIVFITSNSSEASAAESSGDIDLTILCLRPLNEWLTIDTFVAVSLPDMLSFQQIIQPERPVDFRQLAQESTTFATA